MPAEGMQRRGGRQPVEQEAAAQPLNGQTRATQDSAAPCPSAAAPWWPADANGPVLALHLAGGMAVVMGHLVVAVRSWHATDPHGRLLMLLLGAVKICITGAALRWPGGYWRRRFWAQPTARILFYSIPSCRSLRVGTSLMLERAPRPGVRGALADFGTALAGTRQLARFTGGVCLLMPPATTLVTQLLLLLLTRNDHYCEVPLLQAPLTQQRVAALASALEYLTLPIRLLQPAASSPLRRGTAPPVPVCRATLSFVQIALTVMAPVLVSVYSWRPPPQQSEQQLQQEAQASSSSSSQGGIGRLCLQLSAHIAAGFDMANRALQLALYSPAGVDSRAVVCWWLLAVSWWLAKRSEGLY